LVRFQAGVFDTVKGIIMRLQPLTAIFAGLFLTSLGFNFLLYSDIQRLKKLDNKPARIIIERPPEIHIKPKVWGYTK
jgi:hypothetical protein